MPWRHLPDWMTHAPEWVQVTIGFVTLLVAAGIGAMAKIADDVKSGNRDKFWTKKLFLEVPAVGMMALTGWGIAEWQSFDVGAACALTSFLGWAGPKAVEALIALRFPWFGRK